MGNSTRDKLNETADQVAANVAHAADWLREKTGVTPGRIEGSDAGLGGIRPHMEVIASCGTKVGVVDGLENQFIKLTKSDSPDGTHRYLPTSMVDHVDRHVHLNKNSQEAIAGCKLDAGSCGPCG